jgi:Ser/Thr protein kinase RdoA (MazF antagonist)
MPPKPLLLLSRTGRANRLRRVATAALAAHGLIGARLRTLSIQDNVLFHEGDAAVIDFDDCGLGPWAYDFAAALAYLRLRPDWGLLRDGFFRGYASVRPAPVRHVEQLDGLILGRLTGVAL